MKRKTRIGEGVTLTRSRASAAHLVFEFVAKAPKSSDDGHIPYLVNSHYWSVFQKRGDLEGLEYEEKTWVHEKRTHDMFALIPLRLRVPRAAPTANTSKLKQGTSPE